LFTWEVEEPDDLQEILGVILKIIGIGVFFEEHQDIQFLDFVSPVEAAAGKVGQDTGEVSIAF
jgi:hypothetical protein